MPFYLSPGVTVIEKDFTSIIPAVSTSIGAFAGLYQWGPVMEPVTVSSENDLVQRFGKPNDSTAQSFFSAANFLGYANNLLNVRIDTANSLNAVSSSSAGSLYAATVEAAGTGFTDIPVITFNPTSSGATGTAKLKVVGVTIANGGTGYAVNDTVTVNIGSGVEAVFKVDTLNGTAVATGGLSITTAGSYTDINATSLTGVTTYKLSGNGTGLTVTLALGIETVAVSGGTFASIPEVWIDGSVSTNDASVTVELASGGIKIMNKDHYDSLTLSNEDVGIWAAKYPGTMGNSITIAMCDSTGWANWGWADYFDGQPTTSAMADAAGGTNDEMHIIVIDTNGVFTGTKDTVLEKYAFVSKNKDNRRSDGTNNYYRDVINNSSKYIWWMDHYDSSFGGISSTSYTAFGSYETGLEGGVDDFSTSNADYINGYRLFANDEMYDVSLVIAGTANEIIAKDIINNVAEVRKDVVAFISPVYIDGSSYGSAGDIIIGTGSDAANAINEYRNELPSSSYASLDSGYKYQYDTYNDTYRWVPLNADVAGLCARTDNTNDPWWSPGGFNRGQVKNVVKLAVNPTKTDRDMIYKNGINPIVNFPGQGVILYGDKTLLARPSAFDRINVRRLFIVLEKAIATAAKYQLFEFNDAFTRAQFKAMVEPFLRDVQGRRGVIDFRVKCDDTNNTGEVIDRNEFIADIFIKPNRSINFITLNFIAARTAVSFEEIGG